MRSYFIITFNYWSFTLTDGALRMLVLLYFHQLGFSPIEIAMLFIFYEFFGVITNVVGGWIGAQIGLEKTMQLGLLLQISTMLVLSVPMELLTVPLVMICQGVSGIAKDLNKMSAKSSMKWLIRGEGTLYRVVSFLTGSKNTLKGIGFFLGAFLLEFFGFRGSVFLMAIALGLVFFLSFLYLESGIGKSSGKIKFREIFSDSAYINILSLARLLLFCARDVWFVIALPVWLTQEFSWSFWQVGGYLAIWIIFYGFFQIIGPRITGDTERYKTDRERLIIWSFALAFVPIGIILLLNFWIFSAVVVSVGLLIFGLVFAANSILHSYLIIRFSRSDGASVDVGFYYTANASGRLLGTILSGALFQLFGMDACLFVSSFLLAGVTLVTLYLPKNYELIG